MEIVQFVRYLTVNSVQFEWLLQIFPTCNNNNNNYKDNDKWTSTAIL